MLINRFILKRYDLSIIHVSAELMSLYFVTISLSVIISFPLMGIAKSLEYPQAR